MRGFRVSVSWDSSDAHRAISVLEEVERRQGLGFTVYGVYGLLFAVYGLGLGFRV